jgi:hypothetical protein
MGAPTPDKSDFRNWLFGLRKLGPHSDNTCRFKPVDPRAIEMCARCAWSIGRHADFDFGVSHRKLVDKTSIS